jgi:2-C-methyl-D-erythritol 4-phosphate cytidylyltransferase
MGGIKKEYQPVVPVQYDEEGRVLSVLAAAVRAFDALKRVKTLVVVVPLGHESSAQAVLPDALRTKRLRFVTGGESRQSSVYRALLSLASDPPDYVLIHDGARPWVDAALINRVIDAAIRYGAAIPTVPLIETPKECDTGGFITRHLKRSSVLAAQTPQGFAFADILTAHKKAHAHTGYTDDAELWGEWIEGRPVATVSGSKANRKITFAEDLA